MKCFLIYSICTIQRQYIAVRFRNLHNDKLWWIMFWTSNYTNENPRKLHYKNLCTGNLVISMNWLVGVFFPFCFFKQKPNELRVTTQKREANIPEILHNVYFLKEITFLNWVILYQYWIFWAGACDWVELALKHCHALLT